MQTWERSFDISTGAGVTIDQRKGSVRVTGWEQTGVKVTATSDDEDLEKRMEVRQGGRGGLTITASVLARSGFGIFRGGPPIDLEVMVPYGTPCSVDAGAGAVTVSATRAPLKVDTGSGAVDVAETGEVSIDTGSGSVSVRQVGGNADIDTGSGRVEVERVAGMVVVDSGSGGVTARQIAGGIRIDSGSGSVEVADVDGSVELDSGSGSVQVRRVHGPVLSVDSGGGPIRLAQIDVARLDVDSHSGGVQMELAVVRPDGDYRVESGSGTVEMQVPADSRLSVELETGSGRIDCTRLQLQVSRQERGTLNGILNGGGARLSVETGSGSIRIQAGDAGGPAASPNPLLETVRHDAALENSEQVKRVLKMVEEGKLTPDEADAILRALDEEDASE